MESTQIERMQVQIDRLERVARRSRRTTLLAFLVGASIMLMVGAQLPEFAVPVGIAEGVILRDKDGRVRGQLRLAVDGSPFLAFFDTAATERIRIGMSTRGYPTLWLRDEKGQEGVSLNLTRTGFSALTMTDGKGKVRVELGMASDQASLDLRDENQRLRLRLETGPGDKSCVRLFGKDQNLRAGISTAGEASSMEVLDIKGKPRTALGLFQGGENGLIIIDKDNKTIYQSPGFREQR